MEHEIRSEETVTEAIIEAVSLAENCSPRDLPVLYESIDTDALNSIIEPFGEHTTEGQSIVVRFEYLDYCITVFGSGIIEVEPISDRILVEQ